MSDRAPRPGWMTCAVNKLDHAVSDESIAAADRAATGRYTAICTATVYISALGSPPAQRCPRCLTQLAAADDRVTRPGLWHRLAFRHAS